MAFDLGPARDALQDMHFQKLYTEVLGWSIPANAKPFTLRIADQTAFYHFVPIAEMANVWIFEVHPSDSTGQIPAASSRQKVALELRKTFPAHMLIFLDGQRAQSLWYVLKHEGQRDFAREHPYVKGQPAHLALHKLESMMFELANLEKGTSGILEIAQKLKDALDVEQVTKRFYSEWKATRATFVEDISGIDDDRDRHWYASVLLNRLMFLYFLQRKHFLDDGDDLYLQHKMEQIYNDCGPDHFYTTFLRPLFFEGCALPPEEWSVETQRLLGNVKYLNGGLFLKHRIEQAWPQITIPDRAFHTLFTLFKQYTWNLDDTPGGKDDELRPHVLGFIFEKYINQKAFGAYYTRPEITGYLCERTIHTYILQRINQQTSGTIPTRPLFETWSDLMFNLDAHLCRELLHILPTIKILDPACGSGAFLVSALETLVNIYGLIAGTSKRLHEPFLPQWFKDAEPTQTSFHYALHKKVITENLFGVDLMEEAVEIAKLRLIITLVSSVETVEQLEPLSTIDFNLLPGNSLIGLLHSNEKRLTQPGIFSTRLNELVAEKKRHSAAYKSATKHGDNLHCMRNLIDTQRKEANEQLNQLLLNEFIELRVKYEEATWDASHQVAGKTRRRALHIEDIAELHPFHWSYEFAEIMQAGGGFDIIITNPPWEALKPQAKEFFALHEHTISKNTMRIEDFEQEQSRLLQVEETRNTWLKYQSAFPHQSAYFRASPQYAHQISVINGKKQGTDINLYKLFIEQCYNLLREGGFCGLVVPSGIYTDLGAKQLRELLFNSTRVTGLFGFENNKAIFEGVHRSFKFVVLTYRKGEQTNAFPAAFMRHDVSELLHFPQQGSQQMSVDLIRQLAPDSLSLMEFQAEIDAYIAQKALAFPFLSQKLPGTWNVSFTRELDMTNDHALFEGGPGPGYLPLYEGKMIHQFMHTLRLPRYWVHEQKGRITSLGRKADQGQRLDYQSYRLAYRSVGRTTDQRALIATVLPANAFAGNSLILTRRIDPATGEECIQDEHILYLAALMNSFVLDYLVRQKISANLNMFYIYQLPVPRLTAQEPAFRLIVQRAARLICTTPEFADLWPKVFFTESWGPAMAANDPLERARLRAELDGLVAHLYTLSEEEFSHILSTFPLVEQEMKNAALQAYRNFARSQGECA